MQSSSTHAPALGDRPADDEGFWFTQTDVVRLKEQLAFARSTRPAAAASLPHSPLPRPVDAASAPRPPKMISLNKYSWEDKEATVLVWVEVAEEETLREESFEAKLLPESIIATVVGASGTSYRFAQRLYQPIDVAGCKVRTSATREGWAGVVLDAALWLFRRCDAAGSAWCSAWPSASPSSGFSSRR